MTASRLRLEMSRDHTPLRGVVTKLRRSAMVRPKFWEKTMSDNATRERQGLGRNGPEDSAVGVGRLWLARYYRRGDEPLARVRLAAASRAVRRSPRAHPARPCRVPDRRGAERILAALSRGGGRDARRDPRTWHCLCRLFAARPQPPRRGDPRF